MEWYGFHRGPLEEKNKKTNGFAFIRCGDTSKRGRDHTLCVLMLLLLLVGENHVERRIGGAAVRGSEVVFKNRGQTVRHINTI